ncbi:MAG TPA: cellulose synthase operon protein YhjQ/BcsQ [Bryobacteraceae bacterium]|nr:cellulose synthase operon protein YhjQ/BcsQ [Bryobacteraceae bacterium]
MTALLIAPDRELARQFSESLPEGCGFQILAELRVYPTRQTLEIRLRQLQPEVVLLDVATDLDQASEVVRWALSLDESLHVIALHVRNDPDAVVRVLRQGASEFLTAPFEQPVQRQAVERIRRLSRPTPKPARHNGKVLVFTSAKPGAGASTLTAQVGFALGRGGHSKILLADLDPMSATVSFYLKLGDSEPEAADLWDRIVPTVHGLDALPSAGAAAAPDSQAALHEFLERARRAYDWILLDLPAVFYRSSLLALPESDQAFLVTTPELPSLHLARKAVGFLAQLGFGRDRVRVLLNRAERKSGLKPSDVEKILNMPVYRSFPNDYFTLDRALVEGRPIAPGCELAREVDAFARGLLEPAAEEPQAAEPAVKPNPAEARV